MNNCLVVTRYTTTIYNMKITLGWIFLAKKTLGYIYFLKKENLDFIWARHIIRPQPKPIRNQVCAHLDDAIKLESLLVISSLFF